jgi:hypothetical protein
MNVFIWAPAGIFGLRHTCTPPCIVFDAGENQHILSISKYLILGSSL